IRNAPGPASAAAFAVELHVQRRARSERPVLVGRDAAELAEVPRQMRLIVVAVLAGEIRPGELAAARDALDDAAQAIDAAVELGSEPDSIGEQGREAARTVAGRGLDLGDAQ